MVVVKLMLVGVLSRPTSRPSSGDLRILQGFGVVPTSTILLAGVERLFPPPNQQKKELAKADSLQDTSH